MVDMKLKCFCTAEEPSARAKKKPTKWGSAIPICPPLLSVAVINPEQHLGEERVYFSFVHH